MKKNIILILVSMILITGCFGTSKIRKIKEIKGHETIRKENKNLEYSIFSQEKLPLPPNNFGKEIEYLVPVNDTFKNDFNIFAKYDEDKVLAFYKDLSVKGYGDNSYYWRWKTTMNKKDFLQMIEDKLPDISRRNSRNIFTLVSGEWISKPITKVAPIKEIKVAARGTGGIITHLLIKTSNATYLVSKEFNVRRLFATGKELYGAKGGSKTYLDKPIQTNFSLLPSSYLALEDSNSHITIYGGGFGHGVGMPQYTAFYLAKEGKSYKDILKRYYYNVKIENMNKILGKEDKIKVGITSNGNLDHKNLTLKADSTLKIRNSDINIKVAANDFVKVSASGDKIYLKTSKGKIYKTNRALDFYASDDFITVSPLRKSHTSSPSYKGTIRIVPSGNHLRIINIVNIESYLQKVLPSEMPKSFGLEALKAQAVAARTYAISDFLKGRYLKYDFHVKDTTESQVYNNQIENDLANQAVKETKGKILTHDNKPIDAKYFSTSSGFTSFGDEVW